MLKNLIIILGFLVLFSGCSGIQGYDYIIDYYELLNQSYPTVDEIQITGKGSGSEKTTTGVYQNMIYEAFGINDRLYSTWIVPSAIDYNVSANIVFKFYVDSSESSKNMKLKFQYTLLDGNKMVNVSNIDFTSQDINVSSTPYEYFEYKLPMDMDMLKQCTNNCVISGSIQRVSSSNDYSNDINLFSMSAEYNIIRPALETGDITLINNTYINQTILYNGTVGNGSGVVYNITNNITNTIINNITQVVPGLWYGNNTDIYANTTNVHIGGYKMYDNGTDMIFEMN